MLSAYLSHGSEMIADSELQVDSYMITRLDRNRHGGGVTLFISNALLYKVIFVGNNFFECIIVSLRFGTYSYCVCLQTT